MKIAKRCFAWLCVVAILGSMLGLPVFADQENETEILMNCDQAHNDSVGTFLIPANEEVRMEAEAGKHYWPADPNWTVGPYPGGVGSNGTGFVAGFANNPGAYVEFPVSVAEAGKYTLKICYANGGVVSPLFGIYANDTLLDKHNYAPVGGWNDWGYYEVEVELTTDMTSLKIVAEPGMGEAINLDYISVRPVGTIAGDDQGSNPEGMNSNAAHNNAVQTFEILFAQEVRMEAEAGKHYWPADPNWTVGPYPGGVGSNGTGFVAGFANNPGAYVEFPVSVEKDGKYILRICYANGGVVSPLFGIYANDTLLDKHNYAPVGGWNDWGYYEVEVELTTDMTSLKFVAEPGIGEAINLDYISVRSAGTEAEKDPEQEPGSMNFDPTHNNSVGTFVVPTNEELWMEAESAKHFWPADPNWTVGPYPGGIGSNGTGFVAGFANNPGAYIEYPIYVQQGGVYTLRVVYANGSNLSPVFGIYVDDTLVDSNGYSPVGSWSDWGFYEVEIELTAGNHVLQFVAEPGTTEAINVDYIGIRAEGVEMKENEVDPDLIVGDDAHNSQVPVVTIPSAEEVKIEAEDGKRFWPAANFRSLALDTTHFGYTGAGFVAGFYSNPGAYLEFPLEVASEGTYILRIRYANGSTHTPNFGIYLDGTLVEIHGFAPVGTWADWDSYEVELTLTQGTHTLKFMAEPGLTEAINVDYIALRGKGAEAGEDPEPDYDITFEDVQGDDDHNATVPTFTISQQKEVKMEAEDARWFWALTSASTIRREYEHTGFSGTGFAAGFQWNPNSYIEYPIEVQENGTYILRIRYANGSLSYPKFGIYVDDRLIENHAFAPIGGWTDWYSYELKVELTTEDKLLRIIALPGITDGINIDYVAVRADGTESAEKPDKLPSIIEQTEEHNKGVLSFLVSPNKEAKFEAEDARRFFPSPTRWLAINTQHPGYSGAGFIAGFYYNSGAYLEFPLEVLEAGTYTLKIRYANGAGPAKFGIYLDGEEIAKPEFMTVGAWSVWGDYELQIELTTDSKVLKIMAEPGMTDGINIDYISFTPLDTDVSEDQVQLEDLLQSGTNVAPAEDHTFVWLIVAASAVLLVLAFAILVYTKVLFKNNGFFNKLFKR